MFRKKSNNHLIKLFLVFRMTWDGGGAGDRTRVQKGIPIGGHMLLPPECLTGGQGKGAQPNRRVRLIDSLSYEQKPWGTRT